MASDSNSYMSKFKPQSCFFTDPGTIEQSDAQAFGPVLPPLAADQFRLTSKFTSTGAKAFAPCKGVVLVQPQTGNAQAVNLIIRPYTQPISGLNIKYFIYRGLSRASFFNGDEVLPASDSTSGFINKINNSFISFHQNINPDEEVPAFLSKYIGFDPSNQADNLQISSFFFKESEYVESEGEFVEAGETAFELPLVEMGVSLGDFLAGECGVDIVLSYGDYSLPEGSGEFSFNLLYARAKEALIDLSGTSDDFQKKVKREQVFQFLDAAAYYGFHCIDGGIVHTTTGGVQVDKKGTNIYTDVVSKFFTKNNVYLYIQSDRTRSYNFYGNYAIAEGGAESLKFGIAEDALMAREYGTNGWPLIIENRPQVGTDGRNKMYVQFVTDNNVNTMLYGHVGQIDNAQHNNFCGPDDLRLKPDTDAVGDIDPFYTKSVVLSHPATGPDSEKLNVATFNILIYQGKTYEYKYGQTTGADDQAIDSYLQPNFPDDVFDLINGISLLKDNPELEYTTLSSQRLKLINHHFDETQYGVSAVQTSVVHDLIYTGNDSTPTLRRVTYVTDTVDILNDIFSVSGVISTDTKSESAISKSVTNTKDYKPKKPFSFNLKSFTDGIELINGMVINTSDGSVPNKIIVGLSTEENEQLKNLTLDIEVKNERLFLIDIGSQLISPENIMYKKYKVGVAAEDIVNKISLILPVQDIIVYSLDRNVHFSLEYSRYVKEDELLSLSLDLDLFI